MKRFSLLTFSLLLLLTGLSSNTTFAQGSLSGRVFYLLQEDESTQYLIEQANVRLLNTPYGTVTDNVGNYRLDNIPAGDYLMEVSYVGYEKAEIPVTIIDADKEVNVKMTRLSLLLDDVIVRSTRSNINTATTYSSMNREELSELNQGQDMPFLMRFQPGVVVTSDAGAGVGYTGIRVRGSDATRVNVTINGVPLNDAESHGTFWVDLPDFASSVENLQIQRGVGTSTNGAGAFGASVNVQTQGMRADAYGEIIANYGSFNTWRTTAGFGTGLLNSRWTLDGRVSQIQSDGYVDRASSDLRSIFLSAAYYGKKDLLRFNIISGKERTYQSWNGLPEELLETDRTYNAYTYENQVDDYRQDHYQLHYARSLSNAFSLTSALYYTHGEGFYESYRAGRDMVDYGLTNTSLFNEDGSLIETTDLIDRKWLDNDLIGANLSLNYQRSKVNTTLGGGYNRYIGDHFGEVIWAQFMPENNTGQRYYDNTGDKSDFNIFSKTTYRPVDKFTAFLDLQYRGINYNINGLVEDYGDLNREYNYNFFNPKIGLTYNLTQFEHLYASFAIANREPTRSNLLDNIEEPRPERLGDLELGYRRTANAYFFGANFYYMQYKDQLVLTGNLNDVGAPVQQNVDNSYRTGIELDTRIRIAPKWDWALNAAFSINKIEQFEQNTALYSDDTNWEYLGDTTIVFNDVDISFSPTTVASSILSYRPLKGLELALMSKYVSAQYLDNTGNENRRLDGYFAQDARLSYTFSTKTVKEIGINLLFNNITNNLYESNGWTYFILFQDEAGSGYAPTNYNHYYPQAGFNMMGGITLKF